MADEDVVLAGEQFENEGGPAAPQGSQEAVPAAVETLAEQMARPFIPPGPPANAEALARGERLQRLRDLLQAFANIDMNQVRLVVEQVKELIKIFQGLFETPAGTVQVLAEPEVKAFFAGLSDDERALFETQGLDLESIFRIYDTLMLLLSLMRGLASRGRD